MEHVWQLKDLYPSYDSPAFQQDIETLEAMLDEFKKLSPQETLEDIKKVINLFERYTVLTGKIGAFIRLNLSVNTTDEASTAYQNKVNSLLTQFSEDYTRLIRFLGQTEIDITQDPLLAQYDFYFKQLRQKNEYLLSDEVESIIGLLNLSGGDAWNQLFHYLTSTVEIEMEGETYTLSQIRNLAYDKDPKVRKKAYYAEIEMYQKIKDPIAFALNNIKLQMIHTTTLRGYESVLDQTLEQSRMTMNTLNSMLSAIKTAFPMFRRYMKAKAKYLGYDDGLPFYDLFAPIGKSEQTFTIEESKTFLMEHFGYFSETLVNLTNEMYTNEHIDFTPRKGKRGGAFCSNLPFIEQSRIMLNYDGSLSNVITIAHELGHAYHGHLIQDHRPLNWQYTMPVAETASTFNETLLMESLLSEVSDPEVELFLLESQLSDLNQILTDIYSRYLFETAVFDKRKENFIFSEELEAMMLEAQRKTYGDGLNEKIMHPFMWVNKLHYYFVGLNFYNFPYSFGALLARGFYQQYKENPENFVEKYHLFLNKTTVSTVEEAAAVMHIDVTDENYWHETLKSIEPLIDRFEELVNQLKK